MWLGLYLCALMFILFSLCLPVNPFSDFFFQRPFLKEVVPSISCSAIGCQFFIKASQQVRKVDVDRIWGLWWAVGITVPRSARTPLSADLAISNWIYRDNLHWIGKGYPNTLLFTVSGLSGWVLPWGTIPFIPFSIRLFLKKLTISVSTRLGANIPLPGAVITPNCTFYISFCPAGPFYSRSV